MPKTKNTASSTSNRRRSTTKVGQASSRLQGSSVSRSKKSNDDGLLEFEEFIAKKSVSHTRTKAWLVGTFFVIIIVLIAILFYVFKYGNLEKELKFKAVYLDNGQVYYAKVVKEDALSVYLDEVYYIKAEERSIPAEEEGGENQIVTVPVLIKRGQELHRPDGWLQLNRQKIIAIETIGEDSEILREIDRLNQQ